MTKVKIFYSKKGYGNNWKSLSTNQSQSIRINGDFDIIKIIM